MAMLNNKRVPNTYKIMWHSVAQCGKSPVSVSSWVSGTLYLTVTSSMVETISHRQVANLKKRKKQEDLSTCHGTVRDFNMVIEWNFMGFYRNKFFLFE